MWQRAHESRRALENLKVSKISNCGPVLITQNILPHNTSSCVSKPSTSPLTSIPRGKKEIYVAPQKALRAQAQSIPVLDQRTELQVLGLGEMGKGMRMDVSRGTPSGTAPVSFSFSSHSLKSTQGSLQPQPHGERRNKAYRENCLPSQMAMRPLVRMVCSESVRRCTIPFSSSIQQLRTLLVWSARLGARASHGERRHRWQLSEGAQRQGCEPLSAATSATGGGTGASPWRYRGLWLRR